MTVYHHVPETDARTLIKNAIAFNNRQADELEADAGRQQITVNASLTQAAEFRKANDLLGAQLSLLEGGE